MTRPRVRDRPDRRAAAPLDAERLAALRSASRARRSDGPVLRPGLAPVGSGRLSPAQTRLWFLERLAPGTAAYHVSHAWRLRGPLDAAALERAMGAVVARHDVLRSAYPVVRGVPCQRVLPGVRPRLDVTDLAQPADPATEALRLAAEHHLAPFDLAEGPLLRSRLVRLGPGDHVLLVAVHHLVYDGWSAGELARQLSGAYREALTGCEPVLDPLAVRYADYVEWQAACAAAGIHEPAVERRVARLRDAPPVLDLPADAVDQPAAPEAAHLAAFTLDTVTTGRVRELGRTLDASAFVVLLGAYAALVARFAGAERFSVGIPSSGRGHPLLEQHVGLFVNSLPVPVVVEAPATFEDLLVRLRGEAYAAWTDESVPLERLVRELRPPRSTERNPLFQVWFDARPAAGGLDLPGVACERLPHTAPTARLPLELHAEAAGGGVAGMVLASAQVFSQATALSLAARYAALVREAARQPALPVSELLDLAEAAA